MAVMRDEFWNTVYDRAREDRNIVVLSADFSAPSLDKFRLNLPNQYIFMGISEQNMMLVAAGLALEGKKVFCYAIAPFLTMRCFEQTRLYASGMKLPIVLVGVGAGVSYDNSGYTHHAVEDIAIMRTLPFMKIFQPCDTLTTRKAAKMALAWEGPVYVRLDRYNVEDMGSLVEEESGLYVVKPVQEISILTSGNMMIEALEAEKMLCEQGINIGIINVLMLPFDLNSFKVKLNHVKKLLTLEEHILPGGIGSYLLEVISDLDLDIRVKRAGLDFSSGYSKEYGGRDVIHAQQGMDASSICRIIAEWK